MNDAPRNLKLIASLETPSNYEEVFARMETPINSIAKKTEGDPQYLALLDSLRDLHIQKAKDYGNGVDPLANLRASEKLGIRPWIGCILRCSDKMTRVHSLIRNGNLANESIEDNLKDMAAYCLLALRLLKEDRKDERSF